MHVRLDSSVSVAQDRTNGAENNPRPPFPSLPSFLWTPIITPTCGSPRETKGKGRNWRLTKEEQRLELSTKREIEENGIDGCNRSDRSIPILSLPFCSNCGSRTWLERGKVSPSFPSANFSIPRIESNICKNWLASNRSKPIALK